MLILCQKLNLRIKKNWRSHFKILAKLTKFVGDDSVRLLAGWCFVQIGVTRYVHGPHIESQAYIKKICVHSSKFYQVG
jgi:hypothetical protein